MPVPTKEDEHIAHLYGNVMEEIALRMDSISRSGGMGLLSPMVQEFCFLQLRYICELIALGCLVAHGDIGATKSKTIQKLWTPSDIFQKLNELHPDFYPFPTEVRPHGEKPTELFLLKEGDFLSKKELTELFGKCGDILHKGNIKKLLSPKPPIQANFPEVSKWANKVVRLLGMHTIARLSGVPMICNISPTPDQNGRHAHVNLLSTSPPSDPSSAKFQ
jgi:hypothetical protein